MNVLVQPMQLQRPVQDNDQVRGDAQKHGHTFDPCSETIELKVRPHTVMSRRVSCSNAAGISSALATALALMWTTIMTLLV